MQEKLVEHYSKLLQSNETDFRFASLRKLVLKELKGHSVLDLGCGTGHLTKELLKRNYDVTAIDIEKEMVELAREFCKKKDIKVMGVEDIKHLGKERFDNVFCLDVIEHVKDDINALKKINYVLKPGGRAIITVPSIKLLYGKRDKEIGHYRRYSEKELRSKLKKANLKIIKMRYWNFLGFFPYFIFEKILNKRINENLRYSKKNFIKRLLNKLLYFWLTFEGNTLVPIGITLFCIAKKR